jgi:HTH-type transcriptional regulator/antitoxin HigA
MAQALSIPRYSEKALMEVLPELHRYLSAPEEIRRVPRLLSEVGVRFIIVEKLTGSKMDGVCFWLDSSSPVIGMSIRYDRIDNFWFVLRHEIEHVLNKDGRDKEVLDIGLEGERAGAGEDVPAQERRANEAAADFIVPRDKLKSFVARVAPLYSEHRVLQFASSIGVHPGLVVGQLHGTDNLPHTHFRKFLVKVRSIITSTALTDGWGNVTPIYQ